MRLVWLGMVVLLAVVAVLQLVWFNRDWTLRAYPALVPWVVKACASRQCEPIRFRDLSAVKLQDPEVKLHPRYRNALQVNATLVNRAEFTQRYPDVELLLFAVDGQALARGRFSPGQYLSPDTDPATGMLPHVPVHVTLELAGPAVEAASFHFRLH